MKRFEEIQMKIAESAKKYLEIFNMQVFIEQFTLERENRFFLTLPGFELPYPLTATVSFIYDAFQTGMALFEDTSTEEESTDMDTSIELEVTVKFPILEGYPDIEALLEEVEETYPDTEAIMVIKEILPGNGASKEYEISYSYDLEGDDLADSELYDEIFEELRGILDLVYKRIKDYIDLSWYREN